MAPDRDGSARPAGSGAADGPFAAPDAVAAALRELLARTYGLGAERVDGLDAGAPLFGDGLGLDSLDGMVFVVAIEDHFGVVLRNDTPTRRAFASLQSLAQHVAGLVGEARPA